ncbi:MAG: hypothetical protein LKF36_03420 [Lactobacillus sp.]|jgi:hypothetical protein|nr:hypothetical protein [Lactobacillus sp.]
MNIDRFIQPPIADRPKIRWWVPGAMMTVPEIEYEITDMINAGFGGAEVCPVAPNGQGGQSIEWGDAHWNELMKHLLAFAGRQNFKIDFSMTPSWPLALPSITDINELNQGAQQELDGGYVTGITQAKPYHGLVPLYSSEKQKAGAKNRLLAVTVAKFINKDQHILDYDSLQTLTSDQYHQFGEEYIVEFAPETTGEYVLFGWWTHASGNKTYDYYQIDHFGQAGTNVLINEWTHNLLPALGEYAQNIDNLFIDSLEFETHLDWTPGLDQLFRDKKGYDLYQYLPEMYDHKAVGNFWGDPKPDFSFNKSQGLARRDFLDVLTDAYIDNHIKPLSQFCKDQGFKLRYQSAYGKNLEQARSASFVDVPETECLYAGDIIDFYRLQSGAAHIKQKEIYSIEAAPEYDDRGNGEPESGNYQQTWRDLIWHIQRALMVGVNQVVVHGYSYNGQIDAGKFIDGVRWPGFEGFRSDWWSNSWGSRLPNWQNAKHYTNFIARNQLLRRDGQNKVDVAIYSQSYFETIDFLNPERHKLYEDQGALSKNAYTYEFISASHLTDEALAYDNGRLFAKGPAYKALLINDERHISKQVFAILKALAAKNFPIVLIGDLPTVIGDVQLHVSQLIDTYANVVQVMTATAVPDMLAKLQVFPDVHYAAPQPEILSAHYQGGDQETYFFYHEGNVNTYPEAKALKPVNFEVSIPSQHQLYQLNCWTGAVLPLAAKQTPSGQQITLNIAGNDMVAIVDGKGVRLPTAQAGSRGNRQFSTTMSERTLGPWQIEIESWLPGNQPNISRKENIKFPAVTQLQSWSKLAPGLKYVSGIATYATEFILDTDKVNVTLAMPEIIDTYQVFVNDQQVLVNPNDARLDISPVVRVGTNKLRIVVASTLLNAVIGAHQDEKRQPVAYGILGDVKLRLAKLDLAPEVIR